MTSQCNITLTFYPRSYQFALNYPSNVSAVVLAGGAGRYNEAATYGLFKKLDTTATATWYSHATTSRRIIRCSSSRCIRFRQQLNQRFSSGTIASLAIEWGLMPMFAPPNPNYGISAEKAREKVQLCAGWDAPVPHCTRCCGS